MVSKAMGPYCPRFCAHLKPPPLSPQKRTQLLPKFSAWLMMTAKKRHREAPMTTTPHASEDWPDWLRLTTSPGVSARQLRQLLTVFGSPAQVLAASEAARAQCVGAAAALNHPPADAPLRRARTEHWLAHPPPAIKLSGVCLEG